MDAPKRARTGLGGSGEPRVPPTTTLDALPRHLIVEIADRLPLTDVPSLICTCRATANAACDIFAGRRALDMTDFPTPPGPRLCGLILGRFAASTSASLRRLVFRFDIYGRHHYDEATVDAIVARFLDHVDSMSSELRHDLQLGTPRTLDLLAHCFFLDALLTRYGHGFRHVSIDVELGMFRVPSARGPRHDWPLLRPFLATAAVQARCLRLEEYSVAVSSFQTPPGLTLHSRIRFLESLPELKIASFAIPMGVDDLRQLTRRDNPLGALETAEFLFTGWAEDPSAGATLARQFCRRLPRLRKAVVSFRRRGLMPEIRALLGGCPALETVSLRCAFNPGFPVFDLDDSVGSFFGGFALGALMRILGPKVRKLALLGVPEDEFEALFGAEPSSSATDLVELRVLMRWSSPSLDNRRERMLDAFLKEGCPRLQRFFILGVRPCCRESSETQPFPVFVKSSGNWAVPIPALSGR